MPNQFDSDGQPASTFMFNTFPDRAARGFNQTHKEKRSDSIPTDRMFVMSKHFEEDNVEGESYASKKKLRPLPTFKSLAKENKKLQHLLKISLRQPVDWNDPVQSVNARLRPHDDTSYNNTSFGSDLRLNQSLG